MNKSQSLTKLIESINPFILHTPVPRPSYDHLDNKELLVSYGLDGHDLEQALMLMAQGYSLSQAVQIVTEKGEDLEDPHY